MRRGRTRQILFASPRSLSNHGASSVMRWILNIDCLVVIDRRIVPSHFHLSWRQISYAIHRSRHAYLWIENRCSFLLGRTFRKQQATTFDSQATLPTSLSPLNTNFVPGTDLSVVSVQHRQIESRFQEHLCVAPDHCIEKRCSPS
jgi:hypothetical protein